MRLFLQKIKLITEDRNARNRNLFLRVSIMLMATLLLAILPMEVGRAASGIKIYNYTTKKQSTYNDKQIKVTLNGKQISVNSSPGILDNGIALVSYKDIFANSKLADCVYDKTKGTVTVKGYGTTIVMTINSKTAKVNGKSVTMPVAPVKIKYYATGVTKVLVPSRFVSETLGLKYTWYSSKNTVAIESDHRLISLSYDGGSKFNYTGTQGLVTIDGKSVSLGNMPSIITNNTAMIRAKKVFADSKINAEYTYKKADKSITLTKNGNKLQMKVGSRNANLNGKALVLETAPMIVYNYTTKASYVMVPGSITATSLGYDYTWNKDSSTSAIVTRKNSSIPQDNSGSAPELGDDHKIVTGTVLKEWAADVATFGTSKGVLQLNENAVPLGDPGLIYNVGRDYSNIKCNAETYMIMSTVPFGKVTSAGHGQTIQVLLSNMISADASYQILGTSGNYVNTINTVYHPNEMSSTIEVNVIPEKYTYDLALSEDKLTLYVTVYINSLNNVKIGTNDFGDFVTLTGLKPLEVEFNKLDGLMFIDLPYAASGIGSLETMLTGTKYLNLINSIGIPDKTQLILGVKDGYDYYISEEGSNYTISFIHPATGLPSNPSQPDIKDRSKYEIIIPNPNGLSNPQINFEDDYYNNRFSIKLPGDFTSYLATNPVTWNSKVIKNVSVFLNKDYETEILVTTTKLQGFEFVTDNNNIYVNIGDPRDIYKNIVVLDPGHGGPANGARYFNTNEKDLNLKMLYQLGKKYFNSNPSELKVYYTRETDVDMTLKDRAAYASKMGADLFVSLHMNASLTKSVMGTEVYYSNNNNSPNRAGLNSKKLADMFVNNISSAVGTKNRGSRAEQYTVVHRNTVPAVLIELGFMSNESEFKRLSNPDFQEVAVKTIYETLLQVFDKYPTGR